MLAASSVDTFTLTGDRFLATAAALVALTSVIMGVLAATHTTSRTRRRRAVVAISAGLPSALAGVLVVAAADGGPGTGNGIVGGYAAVLLGLTATTLGWWTLTRVRRSA
jgi:hypothetical protein